MRESSSKQCKASLPSALHLRALIPSSVPSPSSRFPPLARSLATPSTAGPERQATARPRCTAPSSQSRARRPAARTTRRTRSRTALSPPRAGGARPSRRPRRRTTTCGGATPARREEAGSPATCSAASAAEEGPCATRSGRRRRRGCRARGRGRRGGGEQASGGGRGWANGSARARRERVSQSTDRGARGAERRRRTCSSAPLRLLPLSCALPPHPLSLDCPPMPRLAAERSSAPPPMPVPDLLRPPSALGPSSRCASTTLLCGADERRSCARAGGACEARAPRAALSLLALGACATSPLLTSTLSTSCLASARLRLDALALALALGPGSRRSVAPSSPASTLSSTPVVCVMKWPAALGPTKRSMAAIGILRDGERERVSDCERAASGGGREGGREGKGRTGC